MKFIEGKLYRAKDYVTIFKDGAEPLEPGRTLEPDGTVVMYLNMKRCHQNDSDGFAQWDYEFLMGEEIITVCTSRIGQAEVNNLFEGPL